MPQYRIEESYPDWNKGLGPIYQIHNEAGPIRRLKWDYQPTAVSVCDALNNGLELLAEISYKLNGKAVAVAEAAHFAEDDDALYFLEEEKLPEADRGAATADDRRNALRNNGYSDIVIHWEPIKLL